MIKDIFKYILSIITSFLFSCAYSSSDYTDDLGDGYTFISESNSQQIISGPNDKSWGGVIPCTVEKYEFDNNYIVAKQRANPECLEKELSKLSSTYWIIDKKKKIIYGPLDSLTFINKKIALTIPSSLSLR